MGSWVAFFFLLVVLLLSTLHTFFYSTQANATPIPYSALALFPLTPFDIVDPRHFSRDHEGSLKFLMSFKETVYCRTEERLGQVGDGGKWVCHPRVVLQEPNCVVYSLGSNGDFSFEMTVHKIAPHCKIHTFDPTPGIKIPDLLPKNIKFHPLGIAAKGIKWIKLKKKWVPCKPLGEIMQLLGHVSLTLLKMDIEGSEYGKGFVEVTDDSAWKSIAQLNIEIHCESHVRYEATKQLFADLKHLGLELFHREVNPYHKALFEYAFVNPMLMDRLKQVPYSDEMIESAEISLRGPLRRFRSPENLNEMKIRSPLSFFFVDEPHYFHCRLMEPLPGDKFNRYCSSHFQDYQNDDKQPLVLVFTNRTLPLSYKWLSGLHKSHSNTNNTMQFHVWKPTDTQAPPSSEDEPQSRYCLYDLDSVITRKYNSSNVVDLVKVFEIISVGDKWMSLIIFEIGNGFENMASLAEIVMERKIPTFPPIQLLVDVSVCEEDHYGQLGSLVFDAINLLNHAGFKMASKDLQVYGYYPRECHYIFLYST